MEAAGVRLNGTLTVPRDAEILVLFAHGSGSSRHSPRNQFVARTLNDAGIATLLFDLLTREEERSEAATGRLRFDIGLLARRLEAATEWVKSEPETKRLAMSYFGASTGGGAALVAAAHRPEILAVVSRGGRPDLAGESLPLVRAATLLIVGGEDDVVIEMNKEAQGQMRCEVQLAIIPGATHLFEETGTLEEVARLACEWFQTHTRSERP